MSEKGICRKAFKAAFPHTIPIFAGFWFLGMTYGIYMNVSGFPCLRSIGEMGGRIFI
ncbi:hypothetical protein IMSAGC007_04540 [Lachnospiraceae bacterium]|jgi:predicted branched-subunit amino acid permease|nr:hypothetical protein IMSAGC007_04540 [Lachnospiraceae bacterium]